MDRDDRVAAGRISRFLLIITALGVGIAARRSIGTVLMNRFFAISRMTDGQLERFDNSVAGARNGRIIQLTASGIDLAFVFDLVASLQRNRIIRRRMHRQMGCDDRIATGHIRYRVGIIAAL